jgi:hypothetical protein
MGAVQRSGFVTCAVVLLGVLVYWRFNNSVRLAVSENRALQSFYRSWREKLFARLFVHTRWDILHNVDFPFVLQCVPYPTLDEGFFFLAHVDLRIFVE